MKPDEFEVEFIDIVFDEIKHITDINEFFDRINFLSEDYGFSFKKGSTNKKKNHTLFDAKCLKSLNRRVKSSNEVDETGVKTS